MASATDSTRNNDDQLLRWSRTWSLSARILAVNIFALLILAGSIVYLDSFRERLIEQRREEIRQQAGQIARLIAAMDSDQPTLQAIVHSYGTPRGTRLRVYNAGGQRIADNWEGNSRRFALRDPESEPWRKDVARFLDRIIESFGSYRPLPPYREARVDRAQQWPETKAVQQAQGIVLIDALRRAPDRTIMIAAAASAQSGGNHYVVHITEDTRDITRVTRNERRTTFFMYLGILLLSVLLSAFLARTIVRPLRLLAIAAKRVRLGRAREVIVPRFAKRRDEIGELARALSDMTQALRHRIDATEAFAADVAHELKNPLASLRSAVDGLERIKDEGLRAQLLALLRDDVDRLDRLVSDIAEASRLDAELSRTRFLRVDIGGMVTTLIRIYEQSPQKLPVRFAFARPEPGTAIALGDERRLGQVLRNLIDNAISFSPPDGLVTISVTHTGTRVRLRVEDEGPGIPPENLEDIFNRFYSARDSQEDFGKHSGLGLSISKSIVQAHDGKITAENCPYGKGARFTVDLPAADLPVVL